MIVKNPYYDLHICHYLHGSPSNMFVNTVETLESMWWMFSLSNSQEALVRPWQCLGLARDSLLFLYVRSCLALKRLCFDGNDTGMPVLSFTQSICLI